MIFKTIFLSAVVAGLIACGGASDQPNDTPLVSAGPNLVGYSDDDSVRIMGTASDKDGNIKAVQWEQIQGAPLTLVGEYALTPLINFPDSDTIQTAEFVVTVTDNDGATATDNVAVVKFPEAIKDRWGNSDNGYFISWDDAYLNLFQFNGDCSTVNNYLIEDYDNGEFTLRETVTGQTIQTAINLLDGNLEFTPPGHSSALTFNPDTRVPLSGRGCHETKQIKIEYTFRDLPQQIMVNRFENSHIEYFWGVYFDINKTGTTDVGDLLLSLQKVPSKFSTGEIVSLNQLQPRAWVSTSNSSRNTSSFLEGTVQQNENTITMTFTDLQSDLIKYINSDTLIIARAHMKYTTPETSPYGDNTTADDGPWHWSSDSEYHTDFTPNEGATTLQSGTAHIDSLNDQEGEAAWIDIDSVTITVTDL